MKMSDFLMHSCVVLCTAWKLTVFYSKCSEIDRKNIEKITFDKNPYFGALDTYRHVCIPNIKSKEAVWL